VGTGARRSLSYSGRPWTRPECAIDSERIDDMKAVQFAEYGGPEVLHVVDVAEPHAGAGQIRVVVRAAGVNPVDWKIRSGAYAQVMPIELPSIPGADVAGVVDEVGDGVSGVAVGDEVFGFAVSGAAAQYAVLEHYAVKPSSMSWAEAAVLPVAVETATRVLDDLAVSEGQTLLINGAAGGVGAAAVQLARARGATVIGTASPTNHEFLQSLGATPTTYGDGLVERVRAISPGGIDAAFDVAGLGALPALVELTGDAGRVETIADPTAQQHGVRMSTGGGERAYHALQQAARLFEQGTFSIPVSRTFPLEAAADAHQESEARHVRGKLALTLD
jgi:NADPH:quinone reductase-like Zn-dependent oxidoreductase